jgi:hypothetical protein
MMCIMWNHVLVCLEIALVLVQDRCMVCTKHTIGSEIILKHPMVLTGDEAQVEAHFGLFRDSVCVNDLHPTYHRLINHFGRTR